MNNIKQIADHLYDLAKKKFLQKGELEPKMYFLILYPGQRTPVYFPIPVSRFFGNGGKLKHGIPWYASMAWNKKKLESPPGIELVAVCLITDAWVSKASTLDGLDKKIRPELDPQRMDAIQISICERKKEYLYAGFYKRRGKKIIYDEIQSIEDSPANIIGGWMKELYPK
jgi:hypothetical protein